MYPGVSRCIPSPGDTGIHWDTRVSQCIPVYPLTRIHRDTLGYTCIPMYPGVSPCVSLDLLTTKFFYLWQTLEGSKKVFLRNLNQGRQSNFIYGSRSLQEHCMRLKKFAMLVALSAAWAPHTKREALSYRRMMFSSLDVTVQDWLCSFWNEKSVFSLSSNNWWKNQQRFSTLARSNERPRSKLCESVAAMSGGQRGGTTKMTKSCVCCKSATGCGLVAVVCPEFENTCVFCVFGSAVVCPDFWQRKQLKQLNNFYNFLITYLHFLSYNLLITYF